MKLPQLLLLIGALGVPALSSAQGKAVGKPAGVGKPITAGAPAKGKSADAKGGRGQLPLGEKIALTGALKARLDALLTGGTMTYDQATTGWRNQGQLVAAMNAAEHNPGITFFDLHAKMTAPGQPSVGQALQELKAEVAPTTTSTPAP